MERRHSLKGEEYRFLSERSWLVYILCALVYGEKKYFRDRRERVIELKRSFYWAVEIIDWFSIKSFIREALILHLQNLFV